ncbi:uncharacterized protein [Antedon mediterranea]|uniref:uncharacterized protein n=1 Tax=Antedon mediterranea TaxID=105859 RepID=UPI003AF7D6D7
MPPIDVTKENEHRVWMNLYGDEKLRSNRFKFEIGDQVRISRYKMLFEKGYLANWTEEIFTIFKRKETRRPTYQVKDWNGDVIEGNFYEKELQKVSKTDKDTYRVEKILRTKKRNGKTEYFVKWLGYPAKFNSWVLNLVR